MTLEIPDAEKLLRRLHPVQIDDSGRPTSAAFKDPELSVDRASIRTAEESLGEYLQRGYGIASITAGFARGQRQEVLPDPTLLNPAHAVVRGDKPRSVARAFAQAAVIERPSQGPVP